MLPTALSVLIRCRDSLKIRKRMDKIKKNMGIAKLLRGESRKSGFNSRIQLRVKANCIFMLESPTLLVWGKK